VEATEEDKVDVRFDQEGAIDGRRTHATGVSCEPLPAVLSLEGEGQAAS
jgi:hypothetical protein